VSWVTLREELDKARSACRFLLRLYHGFCGEFKDERECRAFLEDGTVDRLVDEAFDAAWEGDSGEAVKAAEIILDMGGDWLHVEVARLLYYALRHAARLAELIARLEWLRREAERLGLKPEWVGELQRLAEEGDAERARRRARSIIDELLEERRDVLEAATIVLKHVELAEEVREVV